MIYGNIKIFETRLECHSDCLDPWVEEENSGFRGWQMIALVNLSFKIWMKTQSYYCAPVRWKYIMIADTLSDSKKRWRSLHFLEVEFAFFFLFLLYNVKSIYDEKIVPSILVSCVWPFSVLPLTDRKLSPALELIWTGREGKKVTALSLQSERNRKPAEVLTNLLS